MAGFRDASVRLEKQVAAYYGSKLCQHGATAAGVDWNSEESQRMRFEQLLRVLGTPGQRFSILDYGCGYGALQTFLEQRSVECDYTGYDVSLEMVAEASKLHRTAPTARWTTDRKELEAADYTVASGVFNVKMDVATAAWKRYILCIIDEMNRLSNLGFAFNMLTSYAEPSKTRPSLYYGDPCFFFDYCKRKYSRHVALLHDYGLWEFTILVRK
jgi:SAM-dependent methyltransferase